MYKGASIVSVIDVNPNYVKWACTNVNGFELTEEELALLPKKRPVGTFHVNYFPDSCDTRKDEIDEENYDDWEEDEGGFDWWNDY